jgi:hypothetical protein
MSTVSRAWVVMVVAAVVCGATGGQAATLLADHFGVNPTVSLINWEGENYTAYAFDPVSLTPTLHVDTVDFVVNDWWGKWSTNEMGMGVTYDQSPWLDSTMPQGEEPFDVEAYYFDDDYDNYYFVMISSFPGVSQGIYEEPRLGDYPIIQGDFAISLPGYHSNQVDGSGFVYNFGVDIADDAMPEDLEWDDASLRSNTVGSTVYRTTDGWYLGSPSVAVNPDDVNSFSNFDPADARFVGSALGSSTVSWYMLQLYDDGNPVQENNADTWVLELTIPKTVLPHLDQGEKLLFQWMPGCRNDGNEVDGYLVGEGTVDTPEPATVALLALGLVPLKMMRRRKNATS